MLGKLGRVWAMAMVLVPPLFGCADKDRLVQSTVLIEQVETILQPPFGEEDVVRILNKDNEPIVVKGGCGSGLFPGGRMVVLARSGRADLVGFGTVEGAIVSEIKSVDYMDHNQAWTRFKSDLICNL